MTYKEAQLKRIEFLKIDIKNRLHKYNPDKYPKVKSYSAVEAMSVAWTLVMPKIEIMFDRDNVFYKHMKGKMK